VSAAAIPAVTGEGLKPLPTSQVPKDNSQAATGSAASTAQEGCGALPRNSVAMTTMMSRGLR
jgi:hypothetical protein